ncbi:fibronectin type III domain-containing protein [Microbulbifer sp. 2304DJ12-6]|uniref:fibronectin type III domain-containing protein n=1 Tax=Microbulbifer sp. 2304DJ12-6 TaxID=3233340 RepID=UPI0039AF90ED
MKNTFFKKNSVFYPGLLRFNIGRKVMNNNIILVLFFGVICTIMPIPSKAQFAKFTTYPTSVDTDGTYTLGWDKRSGPGISFQLTERGPGINGSRTIATGSPGITTSVTIAGREDGVYFYDLSITECVPGSGPPGCHFGSDHIEVTVLRKPGQPTLGGTDYHDESSYQLAWGAGSGTTEKYEILKKLNDSGSWTSAGTSTTTNQLITGLTIGNWDFKVRGCNTGGCSSYSAQKRVVIAPPPAPASISVPGYAASSSVEISWASSSGTTRYELQQQKDEGAWSDSYSGAATSTTVSGLLRDSSYRFQVRACSSDFCSTYTEGGPLVLDPTVAIRKQLYYNDADPVAANQENPVQGVFSRDLAAFRYLDLSYVLDPSTGQVIYRVGNTNEDQDFSVLYGPAERNRAGEALNFAKTLLTESISTTLRDKVETLLLNIYYDRAVAELISANQQLDLARKLRLNDGDISAEIAAYRQAMDILAAGFDTYSQVLSDHPGILAARSASRGQNSPRYVSQNGESANVSERSDLFTGYKDIRVLYDLMNEWGEVLYNTSRLIVSSGETDSVVIEQLRNDAEQLRNKLIASDTSMRGVFPGIELDTLPGFTGVPEAIVQFNGTLSQLDNIDTWLTGETNLLGLPSNAVLIMFDQNSNGDSFDSIIRNHNPSTGSLAYAIQSLNAAKGSYDSFRRTKQSFQTDYRDRMHAVNDALKGLIGWEYQEVCDGMPCVTRSDAAVLGSTIALQSKNIETAQIELERNEQRLSNLLDDIEIEIDRFGQANGLENAIEDVIIEYGQQQVLITNQITKIRERAERARRKGSILGAVVRVAAAVVTYGASEVSVRIAQAASEASSGAQSIQNHNINIRQIKKEGELQALSQQLAYEERAQIQALRAEINEVNFKARIRSMWLQANILNLDIALAEANVEVEVERLVGLMNQANRLLTRAADLQSGLIDNYFADPIHLKRVNKDLEKAEFAFERAQEWMFYAAQALEYKWQEPFSSDSGMVRDSVFALRNADALEHFYYEIKDFDDARQVRPLQESTDSISLKENILGYYDTIRGEPQQYPHPNPAIGASEMLSADDAFEAYLRYHLLDFGSEQWIAFNFDTLKPIAGINFFKGPRILERNGELCIYNGGDYNDKIIDIGVNILSQFGAFEDRTSIELTYGGSSYFRARLEENVPDILDQIDRYNVLSARFWDVSGSNTLNYKNSYTVSFNAAIRDEPAGLVYPTSAFKERSVATSKWHLAIFSADQFGDLFNIGDVDDIEIVVRHKYISRNIQTCNAGFSASEMPQELMFFEERIEQDARITEQ